MSSPAIVPAIVGGAKFGGAIKEVAVAQQIIDVAAEYGQKKIDTARLYNQGASEETISKLDLKGIFSVDTKLWPGMPGSGGGEFKPEKLKAQAAQSVAALNGVPINVLYWHAPDRSTPFEESLKATDELHKQGVFKEFGLSNVRAWEVAEIVTICRERGWIQPTVYQGLYNAIDRVVEDELLPCLRKFGIRFAAYSPLAGGLLTGFHLEDPDKLEKNARFDPKSFASAFYSPRYTHSKPVLERVKALAEKHGLTLTECGVRWLVHHSALRPEDHGVIYGGSLEQMRISLDAHSKGPLPDEIVKEFEDSWKNELKGKVPMYPPASM